MLIISLVIIRKFIKQLDKNMRTDDRFILVNVVMNLLTYGGLCCLTFNFMQLSYQAQSCEQILKQSLSSY